MQLTFDEWFEKELPGAQAHSEIYEIAKAAWEAGYEHGRDVGSAGQPWLRTYDGKLK
jgi:hypothetical protein